MSVDQRSRVAGPRPVVCVVDEARRDLRVARDVLAGRFTHNSVTLTLGTAPNWLDGGLDGDVEWRTEWLKANEGLDLAHAYAVSRGDEYLRAWERLVASYTSQVPVGHDRSEVSARRMLNWLYAWQRFRDAGATVDPHLVSTMVARLRLDADHLTAHLTPARNHRTLELYALLLVALALDDRGRATRTLDFVGQNAERDVLPDGVHCERSSDYHMIVFRSFVGAIANARQAHLAVPAGLFERTDLACDVALHLQRPDGLTPALSDGDVEDYRPLLARASSVLGRADLSWAASGGAAGTPPARRNATFPIGGYAMLRSGWGDGTRPYGDEYWGVFDCGPLGEGGHGHYDHLAVELWGGGHPLVLDAGRFTYADDENGWRRWFKGTAAHNTVCVDGRDQTPYRPGKPKGPTSTARLAHVLSDGGVDAVVGATSSPCYDAIHTRTVALVNGERWVVHDRLRGESTHEYVARWHLAPEAEGTVDVACRRDDHVVEAAGVRLTVPGTCVDVTIEEGWISPTYGVKQRAPVVAVRAIGRDTDLVTRIEVVR